MLLSPRPQHPCFYARNHIRIFRQDFAELFYMSFHKRHFRFVCDILPVFHFSVQIIGKTYNRSSSRPTQFVQGLGQGDQRVLGNIRILPACGERKIFQPEPQMYNPVILCKGCEGSFRPPNFLPFDGNCFRKRLIKSTLWIYKILRTLYIVQTAVYHFNALSFVSKGFLTMFKRNKKRYHY